MSTEREDEIKNNICLISDRIIDACRKAGRPEDSVRLMAVSKTRPAADILAAYNSGQRLFGENRIQEAAEKFKDIPFDAELHMIGHLQRNKAKTAALTAGCVQSIDRIETADALQKWCETCNRKIDFLIELNTSGESSKHGYTDAELFFSCLEHYLGYSRLRLRGMMTIAPFTDDKSVVRKAFEQCRVQFEKLQKEAGKEYINILSMGMSADFEEAIAEGSTIVRVGTSIFGSRVH